MTVPLEVGIAYDLRSSFDASQGPGDQLEEYDDESTIDAIAAALEAGGCRPRKLGGGPAFVREVLGSPPGLVFNIAEGSGGTRSREAHVPSVLEMFGIPYTHSDPLTLAACLDKAVAKRLVASAGVPTPRFAVVRATADLAGLDLRRPVIAKPLFEGSSMGIRKTSRTDDDGALARRVAELLADYREPVLVEEFCTGPEFTVGILVVDGVPTVLGVMEIAPKTGAGEDFVYSLEVKRDYLRQVEYHVPPKQPDSLIARVEQVALAAFGALDCRDVARVDLRVGSNGEPQFLEANPLPGLSPVKSDLAILARSRGIGYQELIGSIVTSARRRYRI